MLLSELSVEVDGLDDYDRARASDMEESRPLYPSPCSVCDDAPEEEEPNRKKDHR